MPHFRPSRDTRGNCRIRRDVEVLEARRLLAAVPAMHIAPGSIAGIVHLDNLVADNRWQPGEKGLGGVTIELLDDAEQVVAATQTDALGNYRFDGVWPGTYALREVQPGDTFHGGEETGSGGDQAAANVLSDIEVLSGWELTGYNFSELPADSVAAAFGSEPKVQAFAPSPAFPFVTSAPRISPPRVIDRVVSGEEYFPNSVDGDASPWRLRVLNVTSTSKPARPSSGKLLHNASLQTSQLRGGKWLLGDDKRESEFGLEGVTPLIGDFDGDGRADLAVYLDGEWFIDLNGNGRWDDDDLAFKLGTSHDQPVVGDWNGDGRDDIGVFAPQRASSGGDVPVAGDFNGQGKDAIGLFRDGTWRLDLNGDGQLTTSDPTMQFGQSGDVPIVGDFDGDGRDEIGVFRHGQWIVDSNHNGRIDAADQVFELGGGGDLPVVADFNGDGVDEPGLYRGSPAARISRTR